MICKLTKQEGKPVNAHIIPESFFEIDSNEKGITKILTNNSDTYPKRAPKGVYDKTIITEEGERILSKWDDYASSIFLKETEKYDKIHYESKHIAYQLKSYNYSLLKLFALSVLWRASVSSHYFYRRINLGPHEEPIRQALLNNTPNDTDWYSVSFAVWSDRDKNPGLMDPYKTRFGGLNYYILYFSRYIMYIKIDKRNAVDNMKSIQLMEDTPLLIVTRELEKSKEYPIMINMARMHAK